MMFCLIYGPDIRIVKRFVGLAGIYKFPITRAEESGVMWLVM